MPSVVTPTIVSVEDQQWLSLNGLIHAEVGGRKPVTPRNLYKLDGLGTNARFASFTDCLENVRCAILERVFLHRVNGVFTRPLVPTSEHVMATLLPFTKAFSRRIRPATPVPLMEYPKSAYSGRKLLLYERAALRVQTRGIMHSDSKLATFTKHEKIQVGVKRAVPRVIQPRKPEYNVAVGRYIRHLEHSVYHIISTLFKFPTVMKGLNAFQVGECFHSAWTTFRDPVGIGLDASRFDQHVSKPVLEWEHQIYMRYYPRCAELAKLLSWQLHNSGVARASDGTVWYKTTGSRCSGDMNTSMGNCLVMTACLYSYIRSLGLAVGPGNCVVFNNGDDCMVILERKHEALFRSNLSRFFGDLGFVMEIEPTVDVLEKLSFCQTQPLFDGRGWRMVRDPHISLSKDATFLTLRQVTSDLSTQLYATGQCGLCLCSRIPILQSYYQAMLRGKTVTKRGYVDPRFYETGFYRMSFGCKADVGDVSDAARVSFYRAFGIVPDLQVQLERYYDAMVVPNLPLSTDWETFVTLR